MYVSVIKSLSLPPPPPPLSPSPSLPLFLAAGTSPFQFPFANLTGVGEHTIAVIPITLFPVTGSPLNASTTVRSKYEVTLLSVAICIETNRVSLLSWTT